MASRADARAARAGVLWAIDVEKYAPAPAAAEPLAAAQALGSADGELFDAGDLARVAAAAGLQAFSAVAETRAAVFDSLDARREGCWSR